MYHKPVLLEESIIGLKINPNGIYVDATFGGGGHSKEILNNLNSKGRLIAFDQDQDAIENRLLDKRLNLVKSNFKYLNNYLNYFQINKIDGLLADFGISSHQIDNESRGFSTRFDSDLDMRMNNSQKTDAKEVVNNFKTDQIEITTLTDIPAKTGLGSSGSFTTGLIKGLHSFKKKFIEKMHLAELACDIEINKLKQPSGKQDQYISTYGGISEFKINKSGQVFPKSLNLKKGIIVKL